MPFRSRVAHWALCALLLSAAGSGAATAALPLVQPGQPVPTLAPMLDEVTPAVVNIAVLVRSPESDNPLMQDPFFRRFFGLPERSQPRASAGSGVIVDAARGYVLTNHHVIKNAEEIAVTTKDRRVFEAKLVGSDAGTDIALLKIEPDNLKAITFGDSDALSVGDFVVAIGNPFGLGQTVTSGIVSALGRVGINVEGYEDFIQTDASINPGNSGGALVDLRGRLVGVNTAIIAPAGGNVGIGFAVPANMARRVMDHLIRFGEVRRGRLGVTTQDLTPDLAKALKLKFSEGAVVVEVQPGSPAEKAGLRQKDVVVAVGGRPVRSSADLRNQLGLVPVGDEVQLKVHRQGQQRIHRARIERVSSASASAGAALPELAGAAVSEAERGSRVQGVVVVGVERDSPAWNHGLRPGDVILAVNRSRISSVRELAAELRAAGSGVAVSVLRGDFILTLRIRR